MLVLREAEAVNGMDEFGNQNKIVTIEYDTSKEPGIYEVLVSAGSTRSLNTPDYNLIIEAERFKLNKEKVELLESLFERALSQVSTKRLNLSKR